MSATITECANCKTSIDGNIDALDGNGLCIKCRPKPEHSVQYNDVIKSKCPCEHCKDPNARPMPIVTHCPNCGLIHVDRGEWATKPHKTHRCVDYTEQLEDIEVADGAGGFKKVAQICVTPGCGFEWQPSLINTVGVEKK